MKRAAAVSHAAARLARRQVFPAFTYQQETNLSKAFIKIVSAVALAACAASAAAQEATKVVMGISGWTGYGPLSLAEKTGLFKKHGIEAEIKMIPQKDRHLALASGAIQCAATAVQSHISWTVNGVPITQIFLMDRSHGADGLAVRDNIKSFADLKGKTIAVSAPGTTPHFFLSWMLSKNGIRLKDIRTVALEPQPAAQAFVSGRNDAAVSYEPYLSTIRAKPEAGRILATTVDYPAVIDTFGCTPQWLKANPKAAQGITDAYFEALDMISKEPEKAYGIMGEVVKQTGEQFAESAKALRWADKAENQKFFASEVQPFMKEAAAILLESGVIRQLPQTYDGLADPQFIR